ncbi:hypothetical protein DYL61_25090 [Pseudomonas nabeulensis]|uniref:Uncharacterized protein n=1 Tax=Pseudomonas nabeulensis TaxID=2293833 RepID=A0A4Z0AMZ0_9PSED|nr:hypothetical protein [Pseudomonas nabeulensis]TFY88045.1 hypothetical protein DYL61_25090 [Pseudomonas nabeulensis]
MTSPPNREAGDRLLADRLIDHLKRPQASIQVPADSTLGAWWQLLRSAVGRPEHSRIRQIVDPDDAGLPDSDSLPPRQIVRFYGYPQPLDRAQRSVVSEALAQGFADQAALKFAFAALDQDRKSLAAQLLHHVSQHDVSDEPFTLLTVYRAHFWLGSESRLAVDMRSASTLLTQITAHTPTSGQLPDSLEYDPWDMRVTAAQENGWRVEIAQDSMLRGAALERLKSLAARLDAVIRLDGKVSLAYVLKAHDLPLPDTRDAAWDLIDQLRNEVPLAVPPGCDLAHSANALEHFRHQLNVTPARLQSPRYANYWEALGQPQQGPLTLSAEQRVAVRQVVNATLSGRASGLLEYLAGDLAPSFSTAMADVQVQQLLARPVARPLADQLMARVGWREGPVYWASRDALMLAAILLDLDPKAGESRYSVAGLNLNHSDFHGRPYRALRNHIELHLIDTGRVTSRCVALAAHLLLAGIAPECLVRDIPQSLYFMSSHAWMVFKHGVLMAEELAPGAARLMEFADVMALATRQSDDAQENQWREHYATGPLIDWAQAQGELPAPSLTPDALNLVKDKLTSRLQKLREASRHLVTPMTSRRSLALADLQRVFPGHGGLEEKCLRWVGSPLGIPPHTLPGHTLHSLVDLHMSGDLQPMHARWRSLDAKVDLNALLPRLVHLKPVLPLFNETATAHIANLKQAYTCAIQYLLAQLPLADRHHLQHGTLQLLVVRQPARVPENRESLPEKMARTGRFGLWLRCEHHQVIHDYELFPLLNYIQKNHRLPAHLTLGGHRLTVTTGTPHSTEPVTHLFTGSLLALDWPAYAEGLQPTSAARSTVVVDPIATFDATLEPREALTFDAPRNRLLATTIVEKHFFLDIDTLLNQARGSTTLEDQRNSAERLSEALLNLIPFRACVTDMSSGNTRQMIDGAWSCFFDLFGLFVPTRHWLTSGLADLQKSLPTSVKLLQLTRLSAGYLNATLNPLEGVPALWRLGRNGLLRLNHAGQRALAGALRQARQRLAHNTPYSRLLNEFDLDTAITVQTITAMDGYAARVAGTWFETPPWVMQRLNTTDLITQNGIWRVLPDNPDRFEPLTSPRFAQLAGTLDQQCATGRSKRSPVPFVCFTKTLYALRKDIHKRRVQALDHIRLIPGPTVDGAKRKLVFNRRVYEVTPQATEFELTPLPQPRPLVYKPQTTGKRIDNEPQFGLPDDELDNKLSLESAVVRVHALVDGIDDIRTRRALKVSLHQPGMSTQVQWVVEADAGVFYRANTTPAGGDALLFNQLDYSLGGEHQALIRAFCERRNQYLNAGSMIADQPLVTLPTLEVLWRQLSRRGFDAAKVARIKVKAGGLSVMKQRELLLNASDQGRRLDINVVSKPVQLDIWPPRPTVPGGAPSIDQINGYLAQQANTSTQGVVQSTGIGSANVVSSTPQDIRRMQVAQSVVMWEYSKIGHVNYTEAILKTGAGNCDQMAHVAREVIRTNGGSARVWSGKGHTFVVVGAPPAGLQQTVDFSEPGWSGLWVCDPWTAITCPAQVYLRELNVKMIAWDLQDISIYFHDGIQHRWGRANDPAWLNPLMTGPKHPQP